MSERNPKAAAASSPRDVFVHLILFVTLYISVISFLTLTWQYINVLWPDELAWSASASFDTIRWSSSALIVSLPLFLWLSHRVQKELNATPQKRGMRVRKWLIYLTLLAAAVTLIVDTIQIIYNFYGGELTTPFALKLISILLVTGGVFGYYLWEVHEKEKASTLPKKAGWLTGIVCLVAIVGGFLIVGSPMHQRQVRFDERRVNDLMTLQNQIVNRWQIKGSLPEALENLKDDISGFVPPVDPETDALYEYHRLEPLKFSLCTEFKISDEKTTNNRVTRYATKPVPYYGIDENPYGENWQHPAGRHCFERTIDPDIYKRPNG